MQLSFVEQHNVNVCSGCYCYYLLKMFCCYIGSQGWGCMNLFTRVNKSQNNIIYLQEINSLSC